ncbi:MULTISPECIES: glutathione S-transferase family protein [Acetobacter]|uniref:Glutathione S-transferase n=2 Tax=Acetobacter TaxID=434 RepID=A0AAN1PHF5_9PROT|nr:MULTISPECIES: glutathione S-transferase family protein [Acetobacter]ANA13921.1 glutathione S-transferase [Acetobacter oryzifermentans]ASL40432.1 glutathione S-transferase [Acetobacter oryzifermentans]AXN00226.1 glutathione S-transferase [Acetobacter pomorum]KAA8393487.1 glutathione S-transferase [Acetobacter sp. DmW_125128]KAA8393623.1 glutathione S-transferase [Acetobacter sp. DmW_125124]
MIKLYYTPGACSLASHIILNETRLPFGLEKVNLKTKTLEDGRDYLKINPRGAVPAIEISPGVVLTQNVAILPYIGNLSDIAAFRPAEGSLDRSRLLEALGFCEDVHSAFGILFTPDLPDTTRALCQKTVTRRLEQLEQLLESNGTDYLLPAGFSQPDALMAVILSWAAPLDIDLAAYPKARALRDKVFNRPATQAALKAEGLV